MIKLTSILLPLSFILFILQVCQGQDNITLNNGDEIVAKVIEITSDAVKYKKWDNQEGPVYVINKSDVFMVKYQNGTKDVFKSQQIIAQPANNNPNVLPIAQIFMEKQVTAESKGAIKLINMTKVNGVERELFGQKIYELEYKLIVEIIRQIWKNSGDAFLESEWFWGSFHTASGPSGGLNEMFLNKSEEFLPGTIIEIHGTMQFENTDNGWKLGGINMFSAGYDNKSARVIAQANSSNKQHAIMNPSTGTPQEQSDTPSTSTPTVISAQKNVQEMEKNSSADEGSKKISSEVDLINKYLNSVGLKSKIDSILVMEQNYSATMMGIDLTVSIIHGIDRYYMSMQSSGVEILMQKYDGISSEANQMGKKTKLTALDKLGIQEQAFLFPERYFSNAKFNTTYTGEEMVNKKLAYKLMVIYPSGNIITGFYDKETFQKVKEIQITDPKGKKSVTILEYSDFKDINGIVLPYNVTISTDQVEPIVMKLISVKFNNDVNYKFTN